MKINLNTTFRRKENDHEAKPCVVEKIIELPADEFTAFTKNLLDDQPFIKENTDLMCVDPNGVYHCLLVLGENHDDGILIESEGADYARYSAYIPNARQIVFMEHRYNCIQDLENDLMNAADDVKSQAHDFKGDGFMRIPIAELLYKHTIDKQYTHLFADMLRENSLFNEVIVDDNELIISVNRQDQTPKTRYRPSEEEVGIMCAKHFLWLHEQPGGQQVDFSGMDLSDHYLMFNTMDEAIFRDTLMHNIKMNQGNFSNCDFTNAEFDSTNCYASIFDECDFTGAKFDKSNFQRASMVDCDFTNADFCCSEFDKAVLDRSNLTGANIEFVDFSQTRMNGCTGLEVEPEEDEESGMTMQ